MTCSQCQRRPAIDDQGLCLSCKTLYQQCVERELRIMDWLGAQIEYTLGVVDHPPTYPMPRTTIQTGPTNIQRVANQGVIGTVNNAGQVSVVNSPIQEVVMSQVRELRRGIDPGVAKALDDIEAAIAQSNEFNAELRRKLDACIGSIVVAAAARPRGHQFNVGPTLKALGQILSVSANAASVWAAVHPALETFFGLAGTK